MIQSFRIYDHKPFHWHLFMALPTVDLFTYPGAPAWGPDARVTPLLTTLRQHPTVGAVVIDWLVLADTTNRSARSTLGQINSLMRGVGWCGGYNTNEALNQQALASSCADGVWVMVTGITKAGKGVQAMLASRTLQTQATTAIVNFVAGLSTSYPGLQFAGACLDFEPSAAFTQTQFAAYVTWTADLATALQSRGYKLALCQNSIDPASTIAFKNAAFGSAHPVDRLIYMLYDDMYGVDKGSCSPSFLRQGIEWAQQDLGDAFARKFVAGLPSYGYIKSTRTSSDVQNLTRQQVLDLLAAQGVAVPSDLDFPSAGTDPLTTTDPYANEKQFTLPTAATVNGTAYPAGAQVVVSTVASLDDCCKICAAYGVPRVCIWHVGGNNPLPSHV